MWSCRSDIGELDLKVGVGEPEGFEDFTVLGYRLWGFRLGFCVRVSSLRAFGREGFRV